MDLRCFQRDTDSSGSDKSDKEIEPDIETNRPPSGLSSNERDEILKLLEDESTNKGPLILPKNVFDSPTGKRKDIIDRIRDIVTDERELAIVLSSAMTSFDAALPYNKTMQKPRSVICDVIFFSPQKPVKVITFTTGKGRESAALKYNAYLKNNIVSAVDNSTKGHFQCVKGVVAENMCVSNSEFREAIIKLETEAEKKYQPRQLQMDYGRYKQVITATVDLFCSRDALSMQVPDTCRNEKSTQTENVFESSPCVRGQTLISDDDGMSQGGTEEELDPSLLTALDKEVEIQNGDMKDLVEDNLQLNCPKEDRESNTMKTSTYVKDQNQETRGEMENLEEELLKRNTSSSMMNAWGPRRKVVCTDDEIMKLRKGVLGPHTDNEGSNIHLKILMFGPTGHGKSALCNGFKSAIQGDKYPSTYHATGCSSSSMTRGFQVATYGDHWIIDMPGIYESKSISSTQIKDIASGRVPFHAKLTRTFEVEDKAHINIEAAGETDVSCVVIVLKYDTELETELQRQIGVIIELGNEGALSYRLVLTHLDECDPLFTNTDNLTHMHESKKVQAAVQRMSKQTGIPHYFISFVKNYTKETETNNNISLQHLIVLESVISSALEQVEKKRLHRDLYTQKTPNRNSSALNVTREDAENKAKVQKRCGNAEKELLENFKTKSKNADEKRRKTEERVDTEGEVNEKARQEFRGTRDQEKRITQTIHRKRKLTQSFLTRRISNTNTDEEKLLSETIIISGIITGKTDFKWGPKNDPQWNEEEAERLRRNILTPCQDSKGKKRSLKILVFGPTGHGKSSFCNGCRSAIRRDNHPSTYHHVASGNGGSFTRGFHGASYGDHWIIDMAGIFETDRITSMNIEDIASGKVPFYAQITDTLDVEDNYHGGSLPPSASQNDVSCVVIVLRFDAELGPELQRQLDVILGLGGKGVLSYHLMLTHLDECDPQFNDTDNIPKLYKSAKVQAAVKRMSALTRIPPYAISFVKNYTRETETDVNSSLLHLRVLERVIKSSLDQIEKKLDKEQQRELYSIKGRLVSTLNRMQAKWQLSGGIIFALIMFLNIVAFSVIALNIFYRS